MNREEIRKLIHGFGSDHEMFFDNVKLYGIYLQQDLDEATDLMYYLQDVPVKRYLEVGVAAGGMTYLVNYFLKPERIYLIDDNTHIKAPFRPEILKGINYKEFIGDSQSTKPVSWLKDEDAVFDLIYIDADHSYQGVWYDFNNYFRFLRTGGTMVFHDICYFDGVAKLCDHLNREDQRMRYIKTIGKKYGNGIFTKN